MPGPGHAEPGRQQARLWGLPLKEGKRVKPVRTRQGDQSPAVAVRSWARWGE